ncbi:MAG: DNA-binding response regulator [Subtercola sp.]|nr:DNA-binding response regulator [Subtercola sp.]
MSSPPAVDRRKAYEMRTDACTESTACSTNRTVEKVNTISAMRELVDRRVLVVEDDPTVSEVAATYLRSAGFVVDTVIDGFSALALIERRMPDLIVLDRMLPGVDGVEVCRRVRLASAVPIILLTALGSEEDRITGLEAGADDYLTKPFSPRELVLRVQSILRRSLAEFTAETEFEFGGFLLDPSARTVTRNGEPIALTAREFDLLAFFLKRPRQVFSRSELLRAVWGWTHGDMSTVTVHVRRLREKIEVDARSPQLLCTVWGVGYRFDAESSTDALV